MLRGDGRPRPVVWCSPRRRARDTADLAGLEPDAVREDLAEWDYGDYEGRTTPDIRTRGPGLDGVVAPGPARGVRRAVATRVDRVIADAERELVEHDLVLVGHGHSGRVLIARYLRPRPPRGSASRSTRPR